MEATLQVNTVLSKLIIGIDEIYERYHRDAKSLETACDITCNKGCGACCHFPLISASAGEAFVLSHLLDSLGPVREELKKHIRAYAARYFDYCRSEGSLPFTEAQQKKAFLELKLPCPLFTITGEDFSGHCGVFAVRPLICGYFQSLDNANLCTQKMPHRSYSPLIQRGEEAIDEIQTLERTILGRSTLGHLPLLLAALSTEEGVSAFINTNFQNPESDSLPPEEAQWSYDFDLLIDLLRVAGYSLTEADIHSLLAAQKEKVGA